MKNLKVPETGSLHGTGRQHITVSNPNFHSRILKKHSPVKKKILNFPLLFFREGSGKSPVWKTQFFYPVHFQFIKQILSKAVCKKEKNIKNWLLRFSFLGGEHEVHQGVPDIRGVILKSWDTVRKMMLSIQNGVNLRDSSRNKSLYPTSPIAAANILHRETPGMNLLYRPVIVLETVESAPSKGEKSRKLINKDYTWKKTPENALKLLTHPKKDVLTLNQPILKSLVAGNILPNINAVSGGTFPVKNSMLQKMFSIGNSVSERNLLDRAAAYKGSTILSPIYFPRLEDNINSQLIAPSGSNFEPESVADHFPVKEVYPLVSGKELVFDAENGINKLKKAYTRKGIPEKSMKALILLNKDTQALSQSILRSMVVGRGMILKNWDTIRKMTPSAQSDLNFWDLSGNESLYPITSPVEAVNILNRKTSGRNLSYRPVAVLETLAFTPSKGERSRKLINKDYTRKRIPEKSLKVFALSKKDVLDLNRPILRSAVAENMLPHINAVSRSILLGRAAVYKGSTILSPIYFPRLEDNINSRLIAPVGSNFEPESVADHFPVKEVYPLVSGKELVFNTGDGEGQELGREVAAIKEKLSQAEKAFQASYSSIYLKMEEELKQKLEINRISEQVIQQIIWRLNIEKERRGFL